MLRVVGDAILQIMVEWVTYLRIEKHFGPEDPVFPKSRVETGPDLRFLANGLARAHWANAHPVRAIFKQSFERAGLPYFNPHSFRNTLVQLAYELRLNAEQFEAWSQNLGHEHCLTTFSSYGTLPPPRQAEIIRGLAARLLRNPSESHQISSGNWPIKWSGQIRRAGLDQRIAISVPLPVLHLKKAEAGKLSKRE